MQKYTDIKTSQITLNKLEFNKELDIYSSKIHYNDKQLIFTTPGMKLVSINDINNIKYKINAEFMANKSDFYKKILDIDQHILDTITNNSQTFFGSIMNSETLDVLFKRSVQLPRKLESLPTIELYVDSNNCQVIDKSGSTIEFIELREDYEVSFVLILEYVNFYKNKYNLEYKITEIKVHNYFCPTSEYLLNDSDSDNSNSNDSDEENYVNTIRD